MKELSQIARSGRAETVVAQRSEFVLHSCISGQPLERVGLFVVCFYEILWTARHERVAVVKTPMNKVIDKIVLVTFVDRRWRLELMRRNSKLAERT